MSASSHEVTQTIEATTLATSREATPLATSSRKSKKKNGKTGQRARKEQHTQSSYNEIPARKDKAVTLKSRLSEAEMNLHKNKLISSSAHMANIYMSDTNASSSKVTSQAEKKSVSFSQLPEEHNSYRFRYQMMPDKYDSFLSLQRKFEQLPFNLSKDLLLINKGNLIISEIDSIMENLRSLAEDEIYTLLNYKNEINVTVESLMINLADSLFSKIYIVSKDIKEALDKCIISLEAQLNSKNITVDLYNTLLTMIADVANEYSTASNYSNSSSSSSDSYDAEESVSAPMISKVLSDEEAARQLYNRFLPLFYNNAENTFKQCQTALAKQLTQERITAEAYNKRLACIKTLAYPPIASTANVYAALFRAEPSSSLASPTTSNSLTLPAKSRLSSVTTNSLSAFYKDVEETDDECNAKDKVNESTSEPLIP